ncbi:MAG: hypothetical protein SFU56_22615 [Capsulimonadales bacterium]|nr:hypothetical protein [Capsulimonadales bacterium]
MGRIPRFPAAQHRGFQNGSGVHRRQKSLSKQQRMLHHKVEAWLSSSVRAGDPGRFFGRATVAGKRTSPLIIGETVPQTTGGPTGSASGSMINLPRLSLNLTLKVPDFGKFSGNIPNKKLTNPNDLTI